MIENHSFGTIVVHGKTYTSDIKIIGQSVIPNWRRRTGHLLAPNDIRDIFDSLPEVIVVGQGVHGLMKISDELVRYAIKRNIRLICDMNSNVITEYNQLCEQRNVCACFHLTC